MGAEHSKSGNIYSYNLKYHPETWKVDMNLSCARQVYLTVESSVRMGEGRAWIITI